jgi:hypothetical protein
LPSAPQPVQNHSDESDLEWQLLDEFRRIPRELRLDAVVLAQSFRRLAKVPPTASSATIQPRPPKASPLRLTKCDCCPGQPVSWGKRPRKPLLLY